MEATVVTKLAICLVLVYFIPVNNAELKFDTNMALSNFKNFNESCKASKYICDNSIGLVCGENHKCLCPQTNDSKIVYDFVTRSCVSLVNSKCGDFVEMGENIYIPCTENAACVAFSSHDGSGSVNYSLSLSGICKCSQGYQSDYSGKCRAAIQAPPSCNANDECGPGMTCRDNNCVCVDQEDMVYDEISKSCKSLVDTACFLSPIGGVVKNCVDNAECVPENHLIGYCQCLPGFDPNPSKFCVWDGISPTEPGPTTTEEDTSTFTTVVDASTTTEMVTTSTTRKPTTTTYNPGFGLIGQPCELEDIFLHISKKQLRGQNQFFRSAQQCIPNAFCSMGKCACRKGYVAENPKLCVPSSVSHLLSSILLFILCLQITYFA